MVSPKRRPTVHDFTKYRAALTAVYIEEQESFIGFVEELMGITAQGATLDETRERLEQAARAYVEANRDGIRRRMTWTRGLAHREQFTIDL